MPKYMIQTSYTAAGLQGLAKDKATGRVAAIKKAVAGVGGKVEVACWSLGDYDALLVLDMPDLASLTSVLLSECESGLVRTKTTELISAAEMDKALAKSVNYRPPGKRKG
ncbi:MAG TPA: GYD domain-containing protein [Rhizomicrobium sp.]|nr:GYD domain-containing protein [Rhizomicrobium sp.]